MYDICHPSYYYISQLGSRDQIVITTAFHIYMELCEVKRLWDVTYKYCEALRLIYLEAKKEKNSEPDTYIPWPAYHSISLDTIDYIQNGLKRKHLVFVFKEGDSSSVYYNVSAGIIKPILPELSTTLRRKEEKKLELDEEIRKNISALHELAKLMICDNKPNENNGIEKPKNIQEQIKDLCSISESQLETKTDSSDKSESESVNTLSAIVNASVENIVNVSSDMESHENLCENECLDNVQDKESEPNSSEINSPLPHNSTSNGNCNGTEKNDIK